MPLWENRCKIAISGVGYSKVSRSADIPLAAHALEAVKGAVADSGLEMNDIDGLSTYPELPATGHAEVDGISVVSVNCMMAMAKLPNLTWHMQVGNNNIGGAVQTAASALLAGMCNYVVVWRAMHNPKGTYQNLPGSQAAGPLQFTAPFGFGGPGQHMAVAYARYLEKNNQCRDKMVTLALTQRKHTQHNPHAFFHGTPLTRDDYFNSRPRDSRIGAWASAQSRPLEGRFALETAVAMYAAKYAIGTVPRPSHWSGFRILPLSIEFWHDRPFRLHDRVVFRRENQSAGWTKAKLYP